MTTFSCTNDFRDYFALSGSCSNSQNDVFTNEQPVSFRSSGSGSTFRDSFKAHRSQRVVLPYVTHYSDSGFGSALSSGSSCSYLPPPPPYRMRSKNHKILRSFSDSKYSVGQQSAIAAFMAAQRTKHGAGWNSQCSLVSF
ncbi:hypothetical protein Y032_0037g3374 [Ancylostoma ceylanicum]|uniref:Uncharacterized protein n=1 Tax=Ancylostoma ceylanicum TaxID=53326 RepID=A0A016UJV9_9BILA|nr:hypothetical protein Y032_0037g3374 [Ancylostoma ceylanicum]